MADHDWRRHGSYLACSRCKKIYRQAYALELCKKPHGKKKPPKTEDFAPPCSVCNQPLQGNDLDCFIESDGDIDTHLHCIQAQSRPPHIRPLTTYPPCGTASASGGTS